VLQAPFTSSGKIIILVAMNDFHRQYLNLPNKDLIRITSNPGNYQPAAVTAAIEILSGRIVTEEDRELARLEQEQQDKWLRMRPAIVDKWMKKAGDAISYLVTPSEKFDVRKWIIMICILYGGFYLFEVIADVGYFLSFVRCDSCEFSTMELWVLLITVYTPAMIFLLLRKNIFGWGLLLTSIIFGLISYVSYLFTRTGIIDEIPKMLFHTSFRAAILFFLLKKEVRDYFFKRPKENLENFLEESSTERIPE
jgi:hypothetical protein